MLWAASSWTTSESRATSRRAAARIEMLCIYEVSGGLIRRATFAIGDKVLEPGTVA